MTHFPERISVVKRRLTTLIRGSIEIWGALSSFQILDKTFLDSTHMTLSFFVVLNMKVVPVHAMRAYAGVEVYLHIYLTSKLDGQLHPPTAVTPL
jgi:hypothetical protein